MDPKSISYQAGLRHVFRVLERRKDFVQDHDLWIELYYRSVMAYPFQTSLAGLPFVNVTKHNHVLRFYMDLKAPADVPLLHWDTHSDLSPIEGSRAMIRHAAAGKGLAAQNTCWDIGAAMTGVLLLPGPPRNFVWITPSWVIDPEDDVRYWKHEAGSKNVVLAHCDAKKDHPLCSIRLYANRCPCKGPSGTISTVNLSRGDGQAKMRRLLSLVPPGRYLLDIDLDVFVCNGRPVRRELYLKEGYDVCSTDRCRMKELNDLPREVFNKHARQYFDLNRSFRREVRLLGGRLKAFERQLRALKAAGRHPCAVSISDSTGVNFTDCDSCVATGNNYMPTYFAVYVNVKVRSILQRVLA